MLKKNIIIPLGLLLLCPWASLVAKARVIERPDSPCPPKEEAVEQPMVKHTPSSLLTRKKQHHYHALSGSLALRYLDVGDLKLDSFNGRAIADLSVVKREGGTISGEIKPNKNREIVLDYSLMYQYRPAPSYSFGLSFDKLQVPRTEIDLRYVPATTPLPPNEQDWDLIGSDLISDEAETLEDEPMAVGNFYQPRYIGNRTYCYELVARAYVFPSLAFDPFFQVTVGWAHNRAAVHRDDGARSIHSSDKAWTWSVGFGGSHPVTESLSLESSLQLRNQHKFYFKDTVKSYTTGTNEYTLSGSFDKYYSLDLKVTLRQIW